MILVLIDTNNNEQFLFAIEWMHVSFSKKDIRAAHLLAYLYLFVLYYRVSEYITLYSIFLTLYIVYSMFILFNIYYATIINNNVTCGL